MTGPEWRLNPHWMNQNGGGVAAWIRLFKKRIEKTGLPCSVLWFPAADILPLFFFLPCLFKGSVIHLLSLPLRTPLIHSANTSNLQITQKGEYFWLPTKRILQSQSQMHDQWEFGSHAAAGHAPKQSAQHIWSRVYSNLGASLGHIQAPNNGVFII